MRRTLAVVILSVLAACGGEDSPRSPTTTRSTSTSASSTPTTPTTPTTAPADPDLAAVSVSLTEVATGLDQPIALAVRTGDDALYVAEKTGQVKALREGRADLVLDLSGEVSSGGEQGLLGVTFSPDGEHMYVDFTDVKGDTRVEEFAVRDRGVDLSTRRVVFAVDQPFSNHNGGEVIFGPDGMLYIGLGDGGAAGDPNGNAQNLRSHLGKILRIDPRPSGGAPYGVPNDNPFVSTADAAPEVWQYGLRNPWRFSFDRATGDVWIGDVGQNAWEEIDFVPAAEAGGVDWGWDLREGTHEFEGERPPGARDPIHEYPNPDQGTAVTGGYVYRGSAISALRSAYVFADSSRGELMALVQEGGLAVDVRSLGVNAGYVSSFGEGADGELYVLDIKGGRLLQLTPR